MTNCDELQKEVQARLGVTKRKLQIHLNRSLNPKFLLTLTLCTIFLSVVLLYTQINLPSTSLHGNISPDRIRINSNEELIPLVPFELNKVNNNFLEEVTKSLGTKLSATDSCQKQIIQKLRKSCNFLSDEEIGKLSVMLMNCQSSSEGRAIYMCSENMVLSECTKKFDKDTWNTFDTVKGLAKNLCIAIRQDLFQSVVEAMINKLVNSTNHHLEMMEKLKNNEKQLEKTTVTTIDAINNNNLKILRVQQELIKTSELQFRTAENIMNLALREKFIFQHSQTEVHSFLKNLKEKLENRIKEVSQQDKQMQKLFNNITNNFSKLQVAVKNITKKLMDNNETISKQSVKAKNEFDTTLNQLETIQYVLSNLTKLTHCFQNEYKSKMLWLAKYFGKGNIIQKVANITLHLIYLLFGMVFLIFINADQKSRAIFLSVFLVNTLAVLGNLIDCNMSLLTGLIFILLGGDRLTKLVKKYGNINYIKTLIKILAKERESENVIPEEVSDIQMEKQISEKNLGNEIVNHNETSLPSHHYSNQNSNQNMSQDLLEYFVGPNCRKIQSYTPSISSTHIRNYRCQHILSWGTQCTSRASPSSDYCLAHSKEACGSRMKYPFK